MQLITICFLVVEITFVQSKVDCGGYTARNCFACPGLFRLRHCGGECVWKSRKFFLKIFDFGRCVKKPTTNQAKPPVHGGIGQWSSWTICSSDCRRHRTRKCDNPVPENGGTECPGISRKMSKKCKRGKCKGQPQNSIEEEGDEKCGKRFVTQAITRITNGKNANRGRFPWQAALGYKMPGNDTIRYLCGGSVVSKR